jgi:hypothetical protein
MFDLRFYREVKNVLSWTNEAPGIYVANMKEKIRHKKEKKAKDSITDEFLANEFRELRRYVIDEYIHYFGLEFKFGSYDRFSDKISDVHLVEG